MTKGLIDAAAGSTRGLAALDLRTVAAICATLMVGAILGAASSYLFARQAATLALELKASLAAALLRRRLAFHLRTPSGEIVSRVTADVDTVARFFGQQLQAFIVALITLVGSVTALLLLDAVLTALILGVIATAFLIIVPIVAVVGAASARISANGAKLSALLNTLFGQVAHVKSHVAEEYELHRVEAVLRSIWGDFLKVGRVNATMAPLMSLTITLSAVVVVVFGATRLMAGHISPGTLTAFLLYIVSIIAPLIQASMSVTAYHAAVGSSAWLRDILDDDRHDEALNVGEEFQIDMRPTPAKLRLIDVRFAHDGMDTPVLDGANAVFKSGELTAVVGVSGAGKSSLLFLIDRLLAPTAGSIQWNGADIGRSPLHVWRRSVRIVAQDSPVVAGTIRQNVLYGLDRLEDEAVWRALSMSALDDFVAGLPHGLDSWVEERGGNLSGGQRQRLALARAFVAEPAIVLVDEGTSALDALAEAHVARSLKLFAEERVVIFVSHRQAILEVADRVLRLEDGQLRELLPGRSVGDEVIAACRCGSGGALAQSSHRLDASELRSPASR